MKKFAFLLLFLFSSHVFANQIISVPNKLDVQMTRDWLLINSLESVTVQNSGTIVNVIIHPFMRNDAGASLNGIIAICNGTTTHVAAGSFFTCQAYANNNVAWTNDNAIPDTWAQGQVTVGFPSLKK
ncbi:MAG: hypothetical protein A3F42_00735 [Gammaproteobacteria bacterium RIFCSPHIGHO2_12_FULL_37_34]|nr:MAG: hypothetical protein A3F42_00735 [Gammaproteobacteria bacterium RIFCSPHIGHO2_12_FULL_37_34]